MHVHAHMCVFSSLAEYGPTCVWFHIMNGIILLLLVVDYNVNLQTALTVISESNNLAKLLLIVTEVF